MRNGRGLKTAGVRIAALLALLTLLAAVPAAQAQSAEDPQLVFTIYGGLGTGSQLWGATSIVGAPGGPPPQTDSLRLERWMRPGLIAGLSAAYYRSPHFGWVLDIGYFGLGTEQRCLGPATYKDTVQTRQVCTSANGEHIGTGVVGFMAGATYRVASTSRVQPFVRATAGLGLVDGNFIQTTGSAFVSSPSGCQTGCYFGLLNDSTSHSLTWIANLATGLSVELSPGYRVRFEARDVITSLPVVRASGPLLSADNPPTGWTTKHIPSFLIGLDIVLERRHARRY
jgi:hypothetical protein